MTDYALGVADALAATLNLSRTVARIADLAVPATGRWAVAVVACGDDLHVAAAPAAGPARRFERDDLDPAVAAALARTFDDPLTGADALLAASVAGRPRTGPATAVPLRVAGSAAAALVVGGRPGPHLDALVPRAGVALSAALAYDERASLAEGLRAAVRPAPLPAVPGARLGAAYRAASVVTDVGGDFYEVRADGDGWAFSFGDVCGKGVDAAVLTGQVRQALRTAALVEQDPAARLGLVNASLRQLGGRSSVTALHGRFAADAASLGFTVACAGHEPPLVRRSDGTVEAVEVHGTLLGLLERVRIGTADGLLATGECLVATTDGLVDAPGADGRWGHDRLVALLADCHGMPAQSIAERLLQGALEHCGTRAHDDMAVLVLQAGAR